MISMNPYKSIFEIVRTKRYDLLEIDVVCVIHFLNKSRCSLFYRIRIKTPREDCRLRIQIKIEGNK